MGEFKIESVRIGRNQISFNVRVMSTKQTFRKVIE